MIRQIINRFLNQEFAFSDSVFPSTPDVSPDLNRLIRLRLGPPPLHTTYITRRLSSFFLSCTRLYSRWHLSLGESSSFSVWLRYSPKCWSRRGTACPVIQLNPWILRIIGYKLPNLSYHEVDRISRALYYICILKIHDNGKNSSPLLSGRLTNPL